MKLLNLTVTPILVGVIGLTGALPGSAQSAAAPAAQAAEMAANQANVAPARNFDEAIDRAINRERLLVSLLKQKSPVAETYIQEIKSDEDMGVIPAHDHYFLGKLDMKSGLGDDSFIPIPTGVMRVPYEVKKAVTRQFYPRGFADMIFVDQSELDRAHYTFRFVRREFLGDVRCVVADALPKKGVKGAHFEGRIWIEDQGYNIVRFNGIFVPIHDYKHSHFDSWRVNAGPGLWLPAYIYTQEVKHGLGPLRTPSFRAQTRLWDYETQRDRTEEAFTSLTIDTKDGVSDQSDAGAIDNSPVEQKRLWDRQAEDNILERLQRAGLIAPHGDVDAVLNTVVDNLIATNNLNIDSGVRVRVLLTTPLESAPLGHTILMSRGLIDVLPDEASLAAILAQNLAHIMLSHEVNTEFAFIDRLMFDDPATLKKIRMGRSSKEEDEADAKAMEILKNSPYKDKLPRVGLFLRQLSARSDEVPHLIKPLLGDKMTNGKDMRLAGLMDMAPELQARDPKQVAALPLGSRVKMNPWNDDLNMMKSHNVPLISAKEKLPFEVTPFMLHLTREKPTEEGVAVPANAPGLTTSETSVSGVSR